MNKYDLIAILYQIIDSKPEHKIDEEVSFINPIPPYYNVHKVLNKELINILSTNSIFKSIIDKPLYSILKLYTYPEMITRSLINKCFESSPEQAVSELESLLDDKVPVKNILVMTGIKVAKKLEISKNLYIIPYDDLPESHTKYSVSPPFLDINRIPDMGLRIHPCYNFAFPQAALIYEANIETDKTLIMEGYDKYLYHTCYLFALLGLCSPVPLVYWTQLGGLLNFIGPESYMAPYIDVPTSVTHEITQDKIDKLTIIHSNYFKLDENTRERLKIPIIWLGQAKRRREFGIFEMGHIPKALDLGVAFESLLLNEGERTDISKAMRDRAAILLGIKGNRKKEISNVIISLYDTRSKGIHDGVFPSEPIKFKGEDVSPRDILDCGIELCMRLLTQIIVNMDFPIWKEYRRNNLLSMIWERIRLLLPLH